MRLKTSILAAWVLAVALAGALTGPAGAEELWNGGRTFTSKPKMNYIPNTDVYYERKASGYDRYRYANTWYVVDDGSWYRASSWQGPYELIDPNEVPDEVANIPEGFRRYWEVSAPVEESRDVPEAGYAWPGSFSRKPSMHNITSSGVSYAKRSRDYDLYRFRGSWFLVVEGMWYRADSWRGPFLSVSAGNVPREVLRVPTGYRKHWMAPARYERD